MAVSCGILRFDPQALTSLTEHAWDVCNTVSGFDPQALTSLTDDLDVFREMAKVFRSTGSYEPDLRRMDG